MQAELDSVVGSGRCVVWDERKLKTGVMWKTELPEVLAGAKVAMMIVSDLFLESDFVTRAKLPALLEMERKSGLEICWVLASHCLFELAGLKESDAGNRVSAALDGLGSAQRDAEAAAIARKVAALLGIEPPAPAPVPAAKTAASAEAPPAPKQGRKKRKDFAPKNAGEEDAPEPAPVPPAVPVAPAEIPPAPPAPAMPPAAASAPPPIATDASSPAKLPAVAPAPAPAGPSPAKSAPAASTPASPPPAIPKTPPAASAPASPPPAIAPAAPSPAKPLPVATTPSGLEPAPAPATVATLMLSLDATIQIRQATVLKLSRLARWLLVAAGAIALASVVVAVIKGFIHFLLVAGFAALVAGLALRLHARSRYLGQGLVGMRYTRSGLADESLLSRQREALMRKAEEYLAQN